MLLVRRQGRKVETYCLVLLFPHCCAAEGRVEVEESVKSLFGNPRHLRLPHPEASDPPSSDFSGVDGYPIVFIQTLKTTPTPVDNDWDQSS
jgi:hypothetical protein